MIALAIAVIMAVLDATRTVAASRLVLTPLEASWRSVSPGTLAAAEQFVRMKVQPLLWDTVIDWILRQPGFAVFAVMAPLLYMTGYKPPRREKRFVPG